MIIVYMLINVYIFHWFYVILWWSYYLNKFCLIIMTDLVQIIEVWLIDKIIYKYKYIIYA